LSPGQILCYPPLVHDTVTSSHAIFMLSIAFKCYNLSSILSRRPQKYPFVVSFLEVTAKVICLKSGYYSLVHWLEQGGGVRREKKNDLNLKL